MALSFPEGTILNLEYLSAWNELTTPYLLWGFPDSFSPTLSFTDAFAWRWRTGSVDYHYTLTDIASTPSAVLNDYTVTLTPLDLATIGTDRWILGPTLSYTGIDPSSNPLTFHLNFAARYFGSQPAPNYRPDLMSYVLAPAMIFFPWLTASAFNLNMSDSELSFDYEDGAGNFHYQHTYTRNDW